MTQKNLLKIFKLVIIHKLVYSVLLVVFEHKLFCFDFEKNKVVIGSNSDFIYNIFI
jgi:hypothetical protein